MQSVLQTSEALHQRVRSFIEVATARTPLPAVQPEPFDRLAADIARYQARHVPAMARLLAARRIDPQELERADQIPAVPCEAFKLTRIAAHPAHQDERCFVTSGTTMGKETRGRHPMRTTATYALAALCWGKQLLWPDREALGFIGLAPSEQRCPDSSLSFMLARFAAQLDRAASWHVEGQQLDVDGVRRACGQAQADGRATLVAGTSFAFFHLCDALGGQSMSLPIGSRVMHTGGFKGRSRQLEPAELRGAIASAFRVPDTHVVAEYGMTELSSQLYEGTLARALGSGWPHARPGRYFAPPWIRVTAVDPEQLTPQEENQPGLARIVDLANVDSAVAIQTSDLVRRHEDGSVQLLGRAPGAVARGCSLALEHVIDGRQ